MPACLLPNRTRLLAATGIADRAISAYAIEYRPGHYMPPHAHDTASISLVLAGDFSDQTTTTAIPQHSRPLAVMIKPAGVEHETSIAQSGAASLVLKLPKHLAEHFYCESNLDPSTDTACRWLNDDHASSALVKLWLTLAAGGLRLDSALDQSLCTLADLYTADSSPATKQPNDLTIQRATQLLSNGCTITQTATALNLHPSHLARRFKAQTGTTPSTIAQRAKLSTAAELIITTSQSLTQCALAAGFADQAHMSKRLSKSLGVTPRRLRSLVSVL